MGKLIEGETGVPEEKGGKSSRWWIFYHFWGGVCLKVYLDVSGLSKYVLDARSGSDPTAASGYAVSSTMIAGGAIVLGYFLSKTLVDGIDSSAMKNRWKVAVKSVLPVVYFLAAVLLSMATIPLLSTSSRVSTASPPISQQSGIMPVMAFTTTESSEGLGDDDLDQVGLAKIETWIVETMRQKGRNKYAEMGYNPADFNPNIAANSVYVTAGGKKLAVIKVNLGGISRSVTIMGITGADLVRVSCIRASNNDIPVWSGECGDEVRKAFGVSVQP